MRLRYELIFTTNEYRNWEHATEINGRFAEHAAAKELLARCSIKPTL